MKPPRGIGHGPEHVGAGGDSTPRATNPMSDRLFVKALFCNFRRMPPPLKRGDQGGFNDATKTEFALAGTNRYTDVYQGFAAPAQSVAQRLPYNRTGAVPQTPRGKRPRKKRIPPGESGIRGNLYFLRQEF